MSFTAITTNTDREDKEKKKEIWKKGLRNLPATTTSLHKKIDIA